MQKYFFVMIQPKYFSNSINLLSHTITAHQITTFNSLAIKFKRQKIQFIDKMHVFKTKHTFLGLSQQIISKKVV
tara:strand:+ start:67853 stop:68074 length:222 start_codon:yes stop_codon:yes gene_type:complete